MSSQLLPIIANLASTNASQQAAIAALIGGEPSAASDPAGITIASGVVAQLGGNGQAQQNIANGLSVADVAGGALAQITQSLQDMRDLAVAAANGSNSASDLQALQQQFGQLSQGIDQIAGGAQFNGQPLLTGGYAAAIQTGPNAGDSQLLSLGNATTGGLALGGLNLLAPGGAASAIQQIDQALGAIGSQQGSLGAAQAGLNSTLADLTSSYENLASTLPDPLSPGNVAQQTQLLAQTSVQQKVQMKVEAMYSANQRNVLQLLGGVNTSA